MLGSEVDDESLMALVASRDQRAFRALMERHMARTIALAERIVGGNADADDIGQDAFLRVWNHAKSYDARAGRFTTWLYRIVLNLSIDRKRKPRHDDIDKAADVANDRPDQVACLIADEQWTAMEQAMQTLPERQRAAIALFHMEGLSGREAAQVMELSEKAFESLLIRARAALREHVRGPMKREGEKHDA